ncbi:MerR family transcriptional regulator [Evansella cellulosilytica]|uniref:Transcriptional regulator, MerR family n=1 Tax=Evansella cellulosilytica (strain ATCC 21833 / DSM 2522 / FERM P-1141 / JCM 9156 / N-4) TaxID=649639 RepID=E6TXH8_EVAC2|nr:MerR family transcriptional regulator [Evansella cellulosilytica]ADU28792.1 transcriptional regulator, MerR family [Evansella cellulosilytica DSM 2522]
MGMKVKEVANLVGISIRTLHHYDEINLLTPDEITNSGYRLYSDKDLEKLQQILFFKELGFPLKKVKEIIDCPTFDRERALELQRKSLLEKRSRLDKMIKTIDKTMRHAKGEINMSNKEKFEGFDFHNNRYEQEARERWGDQAVDESKAKIANMPGDPEAIVTEIYSKLAALRHQSPQSAEAQSAIKEWFDCLNKNFGNYSLEAFKGLGQMYVDDERFTQNIDKMGEGLAQFMCDAMVHFADTTKNK